jgi:hypothetical protein
MGKEGNVVYVAETATLIDTASITTDSFQPLGTVSSVFGSSIQPIDVEIKQSRISKSRLFFLQLVINNTDSSHALVLLNPNLFINSLECYIDSSAAQTLYPQNLLSAFMDKTQEEYTLLCSFMNVNPTTFMTNPGSITIPASGTKNVYLPLCNDIFTQTGVPLSLIASTIRYRFYFNPGSLVVDSTNTSTSFNVASMQLFVSGEILSQAGYAALFNNFKSDPVEYSYTTGERMISNQGTLSTGSNGQQTLSQLSGSYSRMFFYLTPASAVQEQIYQYKNSGGTTYSPVNFSLSTCSLIDASGTAIELNQLDANIDRIVKALTTDPAMITYSQFCLLFYVYRFDFSGNAAKSARMGYPSAVYSNGSWSFQYTVSGTLSSQNCDLNIMADRLCRLIFVRGRLQYQFL